MTETLTSLKQMASEYQSLVDKINVSEGADANTESRSQEALVGKQVELINLLFRKFNKASDKKPIFNLSFREFLDKELKNLGHRQQGFESLALSMVDSFFTYIFEEVKLHPTARVPLFHMKFVLANQVLTDKHILIQPAHALFELIEMMVQVARYIDETSGRRGSMLLRAISDIGAKLASKESLSITDFEKALVIFGDYLGKFRKESKKLEDSVIKEHTKEVKEQDAEIKVGAVISEYTDGEEIPTIVVEFLQEIWAKYLKVTLLQHGQNSKHWNTALDDIKSLLWSITGSGQKEYKTRFLAIMPETMKRIFHCLESIHCDKDKVNEFFQAIEAMHEMLLEGKRLTFDTIIVADIFGDSIDDSKSLIAMDENDGSFFSRFREGDWVRLLVDSKFILCKILREFKVPDKTLFVNVSGELVKIIPSSKLQNYGSGQIIPMTQAPVVEPALRYSETLFEQKLLILRNRYRDNIEKRSKENLHLKLAELKQKQAQEKAEYEKRIKQEARKRWEMEKLRAAEEEKQKSEELANQLAAEREKLREEAERLAKEKAEMEEKAKALAEEKRNLEQQMLQEQAFSANEETAIVEEEAKRVAAVTAEKIIQEQFEKKCRENIERVVPGTWIEMEADSGKRISCKLGLILRSSQKMIFVNHQGVQVHETFKEELLKDLISKKVTILEFGVEFESAIESLVMSRRKKLAGK